MKNLLYKKHLLDKGKDAPGVLRLLADDLKRKKKIAQDVVREAHPDKAEITLDALKTCATMIVNQINGKQK